MPSLNFPVEGRWKLRPRNFPYRLKEDWRKVSINVAIIVQLLQLAFQIERSLFINVNFLLRKWKSRDLNYQSRPHTSPERVFSSLDVIINSIKSHYPIELNQNERASQAVPLREKWEVKLLFCLLSQHENLRTKRREVKLQTSLMKGMILIRGIYDVY